MSTSVSLQGLYVSYGSLPVLQDLSLAVPSGELLALLGPSGCGKTTVLRTIAGLLRAQKGEVLFGSETMTGVPAELRGIGMVFQKPLLFPHMSVGENVAFGLKMRGVRAEEVRERTRRALETVKLSGFEERRPTQLSGGQEQRVALARALVIEPRLLLLDEPFSSLDQELREEMRFLVRSVQKKLKITAIFVTHDQGEAAVLADRIALMMHGNVLQAGTPREFYENPESVDAARFFKWQIFEGRVQRGQLSTAIGRFPFERSAEGKAAFVAVRGDSLRLFKEAPQGTCLKGRLQDGIHLGHTVRYEVATAEGGVLRVEQPAASGQFEHGSEVWVGVPPEAIRFFDVLDAAH